MAELPDRILDYERWSARVAELAPSFAEAKPYPHALLCDLLEPGVAEVLESAFAALDDEGWTNYKHFNEFKQGRSRRDQIPAPLLQVMDELNGERFRGLLTRLTGIPGLIADLDFSGGGGLSRCGRGGFLNIHTDFRAHPHHPTWRRRINLIFYLNGVWDAGWGGHTELWDEDMRGVVVKVPPLSNTCLVFNTDGASYHGHPEPMRCPPSVMRRTLALYYFTEEPGLAQTGTHYLPRPGDGFWRRALIRLDQLALQSYDAFRRRFGVSDAAASRVMNFFSRLTRWLSGGGRGV